MQDTFNPVPFAQAQAQNIANASSIGSDFNEAFTGGIRNFAVASDTAQKSAAALQSIRDAKLKHDQSVEMFELDKKQKMLDLEKAKNSNNMTAVQTQMMEQAVKDSIKQGQTVLNAKSTLLDNAEHTHDQDLQQSQAIAKNLYQNDPMVQQSVHSILGNLQMPGFAGQGGADQDLAAASATHLPNIPQAGQVLGNMPPPQPFAQAALPQQEAPVAEPPGSAAPAQSPLQIYTDRMDKLAPEGYRFNPNWMNDPTGKQEQWVKSDELTRLKTKESHDTKQLARQDRLEKIAADSISLAKARTGGMGVQDAKVNAAIHSRELINQSYDQKTGQFNITQVPFAELSESLGALLGAGSNVSEGRINALKQATMQGDMNKALTYFTGKPSNASSQDALKQLVEMIDRQGQVSERLRNNYLDDAKKRFPKDLDPERRDNLLQLHSGSSFNDVLKSSPDKAGDVRAQYNALRASGVSAADAKKQLGL